MVPSSYINSNKPHPSRLANGDVIVGTGQRVVKIGFATINVYSLALYVDAQPCRSALLPSFRDDEESSNVNDNDDDDDASSAIIIDHDTLLSDPTFYPTFVSGKFRKSFRLVFCRSIGRDRCVGGFEEPLRSRCDGDHQHDADELLAKLVPSTGVADDDVLTVVCDGDGKTVTARYEKRVNDSSSSSSSSGTELLLLRIESGGEGGAWRAFQNIYFDEDTTLPTIKHGAVSALPDVLNAAADASSSSSSSSPPMQNAVLAARNPSQKDIDEALEREYVRGGAAAAGMKKKKKTWSEFAGRTTASEKEEGYQFGDLTLGIVHSLGGALGVKSKKDMSSDKNSNDETSPIDTSAIAKEFDKLRQKKEQLEKDNKRLQQEKEQLEKDNKRLRSRNGRAEKILADSERTFPSKIFLSLVLFEIVSFGIRQVLGRSNKDTFATKLVLYAMGGAFVVGHWYQPAATGAAADTFKAKTL